MHPKWLKWTRQCLPQRHSLLGARYSTALHRPAVHRLHAPARDFHGCKSGLQSDDHVSLRKQLKDAAKAAKKLPVSSAPESPDVLDDWELTVGIEIHAQLNASRKLFSPAITAPTTEPNTLISAFDIALPGSMPVFQTAVVLPALRAATALGCTIEHESTFDRKHYFYHDQPAGYQITQYYHPFARNGRVLLTPEDGLEPGETITINIKQVQLEQDTARSQEDDSSTTLIDFNRSGQALIEIISLPELHSPRHAAMYVRKVQSMLYAVDAVTTGMEQGGLRADINVSVRRRGVGAGAHGYSGVTGLGQRTEIKNLSTFKGIEDAIKAERDRQIQVLDGGGVIEGETRGWSMTSPNETRRLRSKEGEVDYRYMPDPDIPPLYIHPSLISWVKEHLPPTPSIFLKMLTSDYGLSSADATTLITLDDGERLIYFQDVVEELMRLSGFSTVPVDHGKMAGNWVLHELGALLSLDDRPWSNEIVPSKSMAYLIQQLEQDLITGPSAKQVLKLLYNGDKRSIAHIIREEDLSFSEMSAEDYQAIASEIVQKFPQHVKDIAEKGKIGKLQFLMGQMMRHPRKGDMRAPEAEKALRRLILRTGS